MEFKIIVGLFILLSICSCSQQATNGERLMDSGLRIENGINRGIDYIDSLGTSYNLRYIPITITNDSSISIHLQITFSTEYNSPSPYGKEKFKLIPLPKEWALDGVGVSETMIDELSNYIDKPFLDQSIEPGEKMVMAIGTLYPNPAKYSGVLPNALFTQDKRNFYEDCPGLAGPIKSINSGIILGLKLKFGESCRIITCGQLSYSE